MRENSDKLRKELDKKLNVIRYDILVKGYCDLPPDFFYTTIEAGVSHGLTSFKYINLAEEFPYDVKDFCKRHMLSLAMTSNGYHFKVSANGQT